MTTLDDKLLGEKLHYYCSSSSGSEDEEEASSDKQHDLPTTWSGQAKNTGPKGVLEDWQQYKHLEDEQRKIRNQEGLEVIKKLAITVDTQEAEQDDFMDEYRKRRILEMRSQLASRRPVYGTVEEIRSPDEFLALVDGPKMVGSTIVFHVYDSVQPACRTMNEILDTLADGYKGTKFCRVLVTTAGLSLSFKISGLPALLVYRDGQIIGNFVRMTNELGDEFYDGDVENFLIERGILGDRRLTLTD